MTLTELLVVVAIIGLLMSIGVGAWISFRGSSTRQAAFRGLAATCRRARVFSLEESAPSRMVLSRPAGGVHSYHAEGLRLVGFWHLESASDPGKPGGPDPLVGFAGRRLVQAGGSFTDRGSPAAGYRGTGLLLGDGGRVNLPWEDLELPRGGQLACYLRPEALDRRQVVFSRGRDLELAIIPPGTLEARVGADLLATAGYRLSPGRWTQLALFYAPEGARIEVDGAVRARTAPGARPDMPEEKDLDQPVVMGAGEGLLSGALDEISVHRAVREAEIVLPAGARLESAGAEIRFDASGMLDRRFHNGPARVGLSMPGQAGGREVRWLVISMMGEVGEEVPGETTGG